MRNRESHHKRQRRVTLGLSPKAPTTLQEAPEADDRSLCCLADQTIHDALVRPDGGAE